MRTYSELCLLKSFKERFDYLKLDGAIGEMKFGYERYLNQQFYKSQEWKKARNAVIIRDNACDLAHPDFPIYGKLYVHHLNPITVEDLIKHSSLLTDPENLVCVSYDTHYSITYGDEGLLPSRPVDRKPNDTCPWRKS